MTTLPTDYPALTQTTIPDYLVEHNHVDDANTIESIRLLSGGFANHVFLVTQKNAPALIIKQAFTKQVIDRGFDLPVERLQMECRAITLLNSLAASTTPPIPTLLSFDNVNNVGIFLAWENSHLYMDDLVLGDFDEKIAVQLGQSLAELHNLSVGQRDLGGRFGDNENHRVNLRVQAMDVSEDPEFTKRIHHFIDDSLDADSVLVHGDLDPKNILINTDYQTLMIDFEEAAVADPAQDVGYLLAHYYLIGLHDGLDTKALLPIVERTAGSFWQQYFKTISAKLDHRAIASRSLTYTWLFLLGRIAGLSKLPSISHTRSAKSLTRLAHQRAFSEQNFSSLNSCFQQTFGQ